MRSNRSGANGVVGIDDVFQNAFLEEVPFWTTPSAPLKEASRLLLDVASTPPMPGGEWHAQFSPSKLRVTFAVISAVPLPGLGPSLRAGVRPYCLEVGIGKSGTVVPQNTSACLYPVLRRKPSWHPNPGLQFDTAPRMHRFCRHRASNERRLDSLPGCSRVRNIWQRRLVRAASMAALRQLEFVRNSFPVPGLF